MKTHDFTQAKVFLIGLSLLFIGLVGHSQGDWSNYRGPGWDWETTVTEGEQPITNESQVRTMFESEAMVPAGAKTAQWLTGGGACTPIHYNGDVFLYYFRSNGDTIDPYANEHKKTRKMADMTRDDGYGNAGFHYINNYPTADDVILCVDGETGKTKWKKVYPKVAPNMQGHKENMNNQTPVAANGKLFVLGASFWLYCFDATTGDLLWKTQHPDFGQMQVVRDEAIANADPKNGGSRQFNGALMFVDGKVLVPHNFFQDAHVYSAFDPETGELLYTTEYFNGHNATPAVWKKYGNTYLIGQNKTTMKCVNVENGEIKWSKSEWSKNDTLGDVDWPVYVKKDYVFTPHNTTDGEGSTSGQIACYKIDTSGLNFQWETPVEVYPIANNTGFFIKGDTVYTRMDYDLHMYDLNNGDELGVIDLPGDAYGFDDQAFMVKANNIVYSCRDASHGANYFDIIDLNTNKKVGDWNMWAATIGYSSHLIPAITDSLMTFRIDEPDGRIVGYDITQSEFAVNVEITNPQTVIVEGQDATLTAEASSSEGSIDKVEFYVEGSKTGEATSSPYSVTVSGKPQGVYTVKAKAYDDAGNKKMSHSALLTVKKWELDLIPDTAYMVKDSVYRFYPHTFGKKWHERLPRKFQMNNAHMFEGYESGIAAEWELVEGGTIDYPTGEPERFIYRNNAYGTHRIVCGLTINGETKYDTSYAIVPKMKNVISFDEIPDKTVSSSDFAVNASASSGLPVNITIESGPATMADDTTVSLDGTAGQVIIKAEQGGNFEYQEAEPVKHIFNVTDPNLQDQTVSFDPIPCKNEGDHDFPVFATASSGLEVDFQVKSGPASVVNGDSISLKGKPGYVTVRAMQGGNTNYNPAPVALRNFEIFQSGIIWKEDFNYLPDSTMEDTGCTSWNTSDIWSDQYGHVATFSVEDGVFLTDGNKETATWKSEVIDVSNADKFDFSMLLNAPGGGYEDEDCIKVFYKIDGGSEQLLAEKCNFFYNEKVSTDILTGDSLQIIVKANQSRKGESHSFDDVIVRDLSDKKYPQSITFEPIEDKTVNDSNFALQATASSGLPVSFSIVSGPASIKEDSVVLDGNTGWVTVEATQSGNDTYQAAPPKQRSFEVTLVTDNKMTSAGSDRNVIYPNPTNGVVKVQMNNVPVSNGQIEVYTMLGQKVLSSKWSGQPVVEIDLSNEPDGIYFIQAGNTIKKVIKE